MKTPKVLVQFKPLDPRYLTLRFSVRNGRSVTSLKPFIRGQYEKRRLALASTTVFEFFSATGTALTSDDALTAETPLIWYRVVKSPNGREEWRLSHWSDMDDCPLDDSLTGELLDAINTGATVAQVRELAARHLGIQDPKRVILVARDGMRRGALQGSSWEVRQVKTWLCRWLSIDVNPENRYVVLRGLGREYLYHPAADAVAKGMQLRTVMEYIDDRLFRDVHRHGHDESRVPKELASIRLDGNLLGSSTLAKWGATYDFELSVETADMFSREESFLLPKTVQCSICIDDKTLGEMPTKITRRCNHQPTVCRDCMEKWLKSEVGSGTWDRLKCPECAELLDHGDVKRAASEETFDRFDTLILRAALKDMPEFYYCLSGKCESGQMHHPRSKCPELQCAACGFRQCVKHDMPWHSGETCEQYDRRDQTRKKDERASEEEVKRSTRTCPGCKKAVYRYAGCNHITCKSS